MKNIHTYFACETAELLTDTVIEYGSVELRSNIGAGKIFGKDVEKPIRFVVVIEPFDSGINVLVNETLVCSVYV